MKLFAKSLAILSLAALFTAQPAEARRHSHRHASLFAHHSSPAGHWRHRSFGRHVAHYAASYAVHYEIRRGVRAALAPIDGRRHSEKPARQEPAAPWLGESDAPDHARLARTEYSHSGPRLGIAFAPGGLRIAVVDENSPAWRAGLSPNDVVKKAGGKNVTTAADFAKALEDGATTGGLRLTVERDSAEYTAAIPLNAQSR